jgi:hypothetical protein
LLVIQIYGEEWNVKCQKSFNKCGISNALDGTQDDDLFEGSGRSDTAVIVSGILVMRILGDAVNKRNFILHSYFVD